MSKKYMNLGMGQGVVVGWQAIADRLNTSVEVAQTWADQGILPVQHDNWRGVWAYEEDLDYFSEFGRPSPDTTRQHECPPAEVEVVLPSDLSPETIQEVLSALSQYFRSCGGLGFEVVESSRQTGELPNG